MGVTVAYERLVAGLAGPISIMAGWIATQLVSNISLFGSLGLGQNKVAHAITVAVTFTIGTVVTYAGHHKWLSNLDAWWRHNGGVPAEMVADELTVLGEKPQTAIVPDPPVVPDPAVAAVTRLAG